MRATEAKRVTGPRPRRAVRIVALATALVVAGLVGPVGSTGPVGAQAGPTPHERFVDAAARDLYGRAPTPAERIRWVGQLGAGRLRGAVATEMVRSPDHAAQVVTTLYRRALGRAPDPGGLEFWVGRLVAGRPLAPLAAEVYGSDEAYRRAGGTPAAYVDATYRALLGRHADPGGRAHWIARVAAGEPRTTIARSLYLSLESNGLRATLGYLDRLRRLPRDGDRAYWADRLRGTDDLTFTTNLVASGEYWRLAQDVQPGTPIHVYLSNGDWDSGARPAISADGRYVALTSMATGTLPGGPPRLVPDVFLLDRLVGRYRAVTAGDNGAGPPVLSADGSTLAFASASTNLVPGDDNGRSDIFVTDVFGGPIRRVTAGDGHSYEPSLSGDGSLLAFTSEATDLVDGPVGEGSDVYVATLGLDGRPTAMERIGGDGPTDAPDLSADGSTLVFRSAASDLVPGDDNDRPDSFLVRLPVADGPLVRLTDAGHGPLIKGGPSVSADGSVVGFTDTVAHISSIAVDGAFVVEVDQAGAEVARTHLAEWEVVERVRVSDDGTAALVDYQYFSMDNFFSVAHHYRALDAEPARVGYEGDLTADGQVAVSAFQISSHRWVSNVVLHEVR